MIRRFALWLDSVVLPPKGAGKSTCLRRSESMSAPRPCFSSVSLSCGAALTTGPTGPSVRVATAWVFGWAQPGQWRALNVDTSWCGVRAHGVRRPRAAMQRDQYAVREAHLVVHVPSRPASRISFMPIRLLATLRRWLRGLRRGLLRAGRVLQKTRPRNRPGYRQLSRPRAGSASKV